jgi:hypothetical protein
MLAAQALENQAPRVADLPDQGRESQTAALEHREGEGTEGSQVYIHTAGSKAPGVDLVRREEEGSLDKLGTLREDIRGTEDTPRAGGSIRDIGLGVGVHLLVEDTVLVERRREEGIDQGLHLREVDIDRVRQREVGIGPGEDQREEHIVLQVELQLVVQLSLSLYRDRPVIK